MKGNSLAIIPDATEDVIRQEKSLDTKKINEVFIQLNYIHCFSFMSRTPLTQC